VRDAPRVSGVSDYSRVTSATRSGSARDSCATSTGRKRAAAAACIELPRYDAEELLGRRVARYQGRSLPRVIARIVDGSRFSESSRSTPDARLRLGAPSRVSDRILATRDPVSESAQQGRAVIEMCNQRISAAVLHNITASWSARITSRTASSITRELITPSRTDGPGDTIMTGRRASAPATTR